MRVYSCLVLILSAAIVHEVDSSAGVAGVAQVEGMEGEISVQLKVLDPVARTWRADGTNYVLRVETAQRARAARAGRGGKGEQEESDKPKTGKADKASGGGWKPRDGDGRGAGGAAGAAGAEACAYRYPDQTHINSLLSTIMNRLTKLYIRLTKLLGERRAGALKTRFRVVQKRDLFFERIFSNMTDDFRQAVSRLQLRAGSAEQRAPCAHQDYIRALWVALFDSSEASLERAALACIDEYLHTFRTRGGEGEGGGGGGGEEGAGRRAQARAARLVRRELGRVRNQQLQVLCDKFQLCYHDLQKPSKWKHVNTTKTTPRPAPPRSGQLLTTVAQYKSDN